MGNRAVAVPCRPKPTNDREAQQNAAKPPKEQNNQAKPQTPTQYPKIKTCQRFSQPRQPTTEKMQRERGKRGKSGPGKKWKEMERNGKKWKEMERKGKKWNG
jgi:hypothetical protein